MGEPGDFNIKVMHSYIDQLDFKCLCVLCVVLLVLSLVCVVVGVLTCPAIPLFIDCLRCFLTGFRLPGEAQKISRLMEKFAQRFV